MLGRLRGLFGKDLRENPIPLETGMEQDEAWGFPYVLSDINTPRYNPDILMARRGWGVYSEMMRDEQVKAVVRFRRDAVTGREWGFEMPDMEDQEEAKRRVALFEAMVQEYFGTFKTDLDKVMSSMHQGFSVTEKVFAPFVSTVDGRTWVGIKHLRKKPFQTFYFHADPEGSLIRFTQQVDGREFDLDPRKFIIHVRNPDVDEHYGRSELVEAWRSYHAKDLAIKFHNRFLERMAGGLRVAKPVGNKQITTQSPEYARIKVMLESAMSAGSILLPSGIDLEMMFPPSTDAFEKAVAMHDKGIAKALLVPNLLGLSEQGQTGSFAQSQTQLEAFLWQLDAEATDLEETLHEQVFKHLGQLNFPDGLVPRFVLKPLSNQQKFDIVQRWKDLVTGNVVSRSPQDEDVLRDMLDMPPRIVTEEEEPPAKPALSGAQLQPFTETMKDVASGQLPKSAALVVLVEGFGLAQERANQLLESIEVVPRGVPDDGQPGSIKDVAVGPPGAAGDDDSGVGEGEVGDVDVPGAAGAGDETIAGRRAATVSMEENKRRKKDAAYQAAFSRAIKRVDFKLIDDQSKLIEDVATEELTEVTMALITSVVKKVGDVDVEDAALGTLKLHPDPSTVADVRKTMTDTLTQAWTLGQEQAKDELQKASNGTEFAATCKKTFAALDNEAAQRYLQTRAFAMTGGLSDSVVAIARAEVLNGIRYGKASIEVIDNIYARLVSDGIVDPAVVGEFAKRNELTETLAALENVANPRHRLETMIRTGSFEAINEARHASFTDPDIGDFVAALEYAAILDSRTTAICNELGGEPHVHAVDWPGWDVYRPPNHYNCRSLTVAVAKDEEWTESGQPVNRPQEGFK